MWKVVVAKASKQVAAAAREVRRQDRSSVDTDGLLQVGLRGPAFEPGLLRKLGKNNISAIMMMALGGQVAMAKLGNRHPLMLRSSKAEQFS